MASKGAKKVRTDPADSVKPLSKAEEKLDRNEELSGKEDVKDALLEIYESVEKGFEKQADRSDDIMDYWDAYNCNLGQRQFYNGTSQIFVPIIYNAVNARKTRFVNQLFPISGRFVEVTSEDGTQPYSEMALLEHYVRSCKVRSRVAPALMKNADIEGQMTVQITWEEHTRHVVWRKQAPANVEEEDGSETGIEDEDDDDPIEDIQEDEISHSGPVVRVIADSDLCVLPSTANSIEEALADGGSVTTLCRWSAATLRRKIKQGHIGEEEGNYLLTEMKADQTSSAQQRDKSKEMVDAAGIKGDGRGKYVLVYRTWVMLTVGDERRLCLCYFGGKDRILSCKRNPYWSDRIDIISAPADKVDGSFKGVSRVKFVADLQYQANDATNEGMDSAAYALMPIIMTDPEKNPKVGQMVLTMAAVWETSPNDTQFAKFPPLWRDALEIVASCQTQIFQTLSVNPSMITQASGAKSKKPSQAEVANEQQIDILTTADAVTTSEDEILSPMLLFMLELDHQYRDKSVRVRQYGETGMKTNMTEIPPTQMNKLYQFRWFGVEAARNAQLMQQQISGINVIKGIPAQLYPGYKLDLGAVLSMMVESLFGPRLAPLTFKSAKEDLGFPPQVENKYLSDQFNVPVHALDNHQEHIQVHKKLMEQTGDPSGVIRSHIMMHMQAMQQQQQAQQMASQPQGGPSGPGGSPRQGATAHPPRGGQQPPGAIQRDAMGRNSPGAAPRPQ